MGEMLEVTLISQKLWIDHIDDEKLLPIFVLESSISTVVLTHFQ